jgi:polysaccharide export outer membrane protein
MRTYVFASIAVIGLVFAGSAAAQTPAAHSSTAATAAPVVVPGDYVIGADDALSIVFWRDKEMSVEVVVRPDGKISLPLLNEVQAAGYTPEQLRGQLVEAASKYLEEPNATVVVKEIRSRKVFITGNVAKPASYPLMGEMNVVQLIAQAGGLLEYADSKNIVVMRTEGGKQHFKVNYNDVIKQKNVAQNISLKPGDTVVVP